MIVTSICSSYREGTRYETNIVRRTNRGQGRRKDIELFLYLCDVIDGCTPRGIRMGEALELHAGHPHEHPVARVGGQPYQMGGTVIIHLTVHDSPKLSSVRERGEGPDRVSARQRSHNSSVAGWSPTGPTKRKMQVSDFRNEPQPTEPPRVS